MERAVSPGSTATIDSMSNVGTFLDKSLLPNALHILGEAGSLAAGKNSSGATTAYLVGGPVRDLLLGVQSRDFDIAVDADGPTFAAELAGKIRGEVTFRSEFGTAKIAAAGLVIDITMIRSETYAEPGALPLVQPGTLEDDLARRDFTINAMAVDLTPGRWGELTDQHGGQRDIVLKTIKSLHPGSFSDDPTRMLRAIRYESRFGFKMDPKTLTSMTESAGSLAKVSPFRRLAELRLIFGEETTVDILEHAEERDLLAGIHPALRISRQALNKFDSAPDSLSNEERQTYYMALIGSALTQGEAESLSRDLELSSDWSGALLSGPKFKGVAGILDRSDLKPSEVVELLAPFPVVALEAQLQLAPPLLRRDRLSAYLTDYQHSKPELNGDDLLALGVPQGPLVGKLIAELKVGRLDKTILSRFEEEAHVKRRLPMLT
ncbi:MAG: CCA tRNA nucleotidyltransferase [Chloroflexi bacterium]|nr:CCA tRNA nucleotidyltransferase [Chloroflexota bacterium]